MIKRSLLLVALASAGCQTFEAEAPEGFATFEDAGWSYRAVSPDGVMYRVRSAENDPEADLAFWREALKKRMLDAGYTFVAEGDVKAGDEPGTLLELAAPVGQEDYTYAIAVFVRGPELILVEVAGEVSRFDKRREAIMAAIGALR